MTDPVEPQPLDLSAIQVERLLRQGYDVTPQRIELLDAELATICRVLAPGGTLAVKVHRSGPDDAVLRWRTEVLAGLAQADAPVPAVLAARDGSPVYASTVDGTPVVVVVESWLRGTPLYEAPVDDALLHCIGRTAATLATSLQDAPPPPPTTPHTWEASRGRATILAALPRVADAELRELALDAADVFAQEVEPRLEDLPRAVVHQDLHDGNLLVRAALGEHLLTHPRCVGVIDFGDAVHGLRVAELAVAAGYAARTSPDPLHALLAVVRGWGPEPHLEDVEVSALAPLAVTRLAVNATVWAARATGTRSDYARQRSARTLPALRTLLAVDPSTAAERIAAALGRRH